MSTLALFCRPRPVLLCFVLILTCAVNSASGQGIAVSPSRIFLKGQPGETVSQIIKFTNSTNAEFNFTTSIKDWDRDSTGMKKYYPSGQIKQSNGKWLSLSSNSISMAAGETKEVNLTMVIPQGDAAKSLTHSMVFFTQVKQQQKEAGQKQGIGINILFEMGVQVYHVPDGLSAGDLEFIAFVDKGNARTKTADSTRRMAIKVKNSGKINKDAYVRFELTNISSGEEIKVEPIAIAMLPDAEQWINLDLPARLKGKFLVVAILDAGSQYDLKVAEKEITY